MQGATTLAQPLSLQSLEQAGAGETPQLSTSVTHSVQQAAWPPLFYLAAYYLAPQSIFAEDPLCAFAQQLLSRKMNPFRDASFTLQVRTGPTWRSW